MRWRGAASLFTPLHVEGHKRDAECAPISAVSRRTYRAALFCVESVEPAFCCAPSFAQHFRRALLQHSLQPATMVLIQNFQVQSPNVEYAEESITSTYDYQTTKVEREADGKWIIRPTNVKYQFKTDRKVPKLG